MTNAIRYSQRVRAEHNAIATAILTYDVIHEPLDRDSVLSDFQAAPDQPTQGLIESYKAAIREHRECTNAVLWGDIRLAVAHAKRAMRYETDHRQISSLIEANRKKSTGRFKDGVIYKVVLNDEGDDYTMYFDLVLAWKHDKLILLNQDEIERMSHEDTQDLHGSFTDLCAFILEVEKRGEFGRPRKSSDKPIWFEDRGLLVLRPYIGKKYPLLPRALEALRRTLRIHCFPQKVNSSLDPHD